MSGLLPDPDSGRELLRDELAKQEYHRESLLERVIGWVMDKFDALGNAASGAGSLSTFAAVLVAVALIGLLIYVIPRIRRTRSAAAATDRSVLQDAEAGAAQLRSRAEMALAEGHLEAALGDAYRALAKRMVERGTIQLTVGSTAHELADRMAQRFPDVAERLFAAADDFDAVVYGDHPAARIDVQRVLDLDDELQRLRPVDDARVALSSLAVPR